MHRKEQSLKSLGKMMAWSAGGISSTIQSLLMIYLTVYCTNALGMDAGLVGTLLMLCKIMESVSSLFAGYLVDRTDTRLGRGRPYELALVGVWVCTWLAFSVPASLGQAAKSLWLVVCYILAQAVFTTLRNAAGSTYMVHAFRDPKVYVKLTSWGGLISISAVVLFNMAFPLLYKDIVGSAPGWSRLVLLLALPLLAVGLLRFFCIREQPGADRKGADKPSGKDILALLKQTPDLYPLMGMQLLVGITSNMTVTAYYYLYVVENVALSSAMSVFAIPSMLSMALYPLLLGRITVKQLIRGSLCISLVSGCIGFFAKDNVVLLAVFSLINGCVALPVSFMGGLLNVECADDREERGLPRMDGTLSSAVGVVSKLGGAVGTFLLGALLSMSGFDGTQTAQPDSAVLMIRLCYTLIPMALYLSAALTLGFYRRKRPGKANTVKG